MVMLNSSRVSRSDLKSILNQLRRSRLLPGVESPPAGRDICFVQSRRRVSHPGACDRASRRSTWSDYAIGAALGEINKATG